ncbi:MAG: TetR/AcrR family transcriptional regulator [Hyphomonadaceae bacterium]
MPSQKATQRVYPRKTEPIIAAAEEAFLRWGFDGASVDTIAEMANVSKKTVYNNFANKEALFAEVIQKRCDEVVPPVVDEAMMLQDPEETLVAIGSTFLRKLFAPEQVQLYRTVAAESRQFPEFGRMMFEGPIMRTQASFDTYLRRQVQMGRLEFPDLDLAASQFVALLKGNVHMQLMLNQPAQVTPRRLDQMTRAAVRLFLQGAARTAEPARKTQRRKP